MGFGKFKKLIGKLPRIMPTIGGEKGRRPTPEHMESIRQQIEAHRKAGDLNWLPPGLKKA